MKIIRLLLLSLCCCPDAGAQVHVDVDTSVTEIRKAAGFLAAYLNEFRGRRQPDYRRYWCSYSAKRARIPDDMVFSVADDYPIYSFTRRPAVFYARVYPAYVHLKTLIAQTDSAGRVTPFAITNHYVLHQDSSGGPWFISALDLHKDRYATVTNRNITYHFPATHRFNKERSDSLIRRLVALEQQWGFAPVAMDYYFAGSPEELSRMRGLDYYLGMDGATPSGISYPEQGVLFCQGLGEDYLHEVLHLYFNPRYGTSPVCHALIYYLAGGMGHDFGWMIRRMNAYLDQYPETDLSRWDTLRARDRMLHIDYTVLGLVCKIIDEREGVRGLKRLLTYTTPEELFRQEFGLMPADRDAFLKAQFRKYAGK